MQTKEEIEKVYALAKEDVMMFGTGAIFFDPETKKLRHIPIQELELYTNFTTDAVKFL